tara:strand:- start:355 stop:624 length:270 start_codon:yes stop_codon:yes gene_type:complete
MKDLKIQEIGLEDGNKLYKITLSDCLQLGNNFTTKHFKEEILEHKDHFKVWEFLNTQVNYYDEFKIIAQGKYGIVDSGIWIVQDCEAII